MEKSLFYLTLREKICYLTNVACSDLYRASIDVTIKNFLKDEYFWKTFTNSYKEIKFWYYSCKVPACPLI